MTYLNQRLESKVSIKILWSFLKSPQGKFHSQVPKWNEFKGLSLQVRGRGTSLMTLRSLCLNLLPTLLLLIFPSWLLQRPIAALTLVIGEETL